MDPDALRRLLEAVARGEVAPDEAGRRLRWGEVAERAGEFATLDLQRAVRCGSPEVVFGQGKTPDQIEAIVRALARRGQGVLVTRVTPEAAALLRTAIPGGEHNPIARTFRLVAEGPARPVRGRVVVMTAGTSDLPVAEEARVAAEAWGCSVGLVVDVGVAGLHRLLARLGDLDGADAVVVVAGMEGALPSVVGGLVDCPVVAVPTSVGYGAALGGLAALLGMLTSCASNVAVVNVDNGFGGGHYAALIATRAADARAAVTNT